MSRIEENIQKEIGSDELYEKLLKIQNDDDVKNAKIFFRGIDDATILKEAARIIQERMENRDLVLELRYLYAKLKKYLRRKIKYIDPGEAKKRDFHYLMKYKEPV